MVSWEREKNPLCIQNKCISDLMQTPRRQLQNVDFEQKNSQNQPILCRPKYFVSTSDQNMILHWLWCAVKKFWVLDPKLPCSHWLWCAVKKFWVLDPKLPCLAYCSCKSASLVCYGLKKTPLYQRKSQIQIKPPFSCMHTHLPFALIPLEVHV